MGTRTDSFSKILCRILKNCAPAAHAYSYGPTALTLIESANSGLMSPFQRFLCDQIRLGRKTSSPRPTDVIVKLPGFTATRLTETHVACLSRSLVSRMYGRVREANHPSPKNRSSTYMYGLLHGKRCGGLKEGASGTRATVRRRCDVGYLLLSPSC